MHRASAWDSHVCVLQVLQSKSDTRSQRLRAALCECEQAHICSVCVSCVCLRMCVCHCLLLHPSSAGACSPPVFSHDPWVCMWVGTGTFVCVSCTHTHTHTHTHTAAAAAAERFKIVLLIARDTAGSAPPGYILLFSQFNKSDATPCSPRQLLRNCLTLCFSPPQIEWLNWCLPPIVL